DSPCKKWAREARLQKSDQGLGKIFQEGTIRCPTQYCGNDQACRHSRRTDGFSRLKRGRRGLPRKRRDKKTSSLGPLGDESIFASISSKSRLIAFFLYLPHLTVLPVLTASLLESAFYV